MLHSYSTCPEDRDIWSSNPSDEAETKIEEGGFCCPLFIKGIRYWRLIVGEKDLFKLTLACLLVLVGWVKPGFAADVADCCEQLYKNGQYEQAFPLCREASEQGDSHAQFILGKMYYFGKGIKQDYVKAVKWYLKASEQGNAKAQNILGWMYNFGKGVQQDETEAV
ncbi:MAG: sel1 repeat family protein, partial [Deltaproteobacteria bacterium]|nr:sel1 repeat family protein [Deltaproteobacteria bacterium]